LAKEHDNTGSDLLVY